MSAVGHNFTTQPWADRALCAQTDADAFYPEKGGSTREAKAICGRCDVREECLEYALAVESGQIDVPQSYVGTGIFGGLAPRERRKLLRHGDTDGRTTTLLVDEATQQQPPVASRGGNYVSGTGHRPIPMATGTYRKAHTPQKQRPTGLDWSKHRAPEPEQPTPPPVPVARPQMAEALPDLEDLVDDVDVLADVDETRVPGAAAKPHRCSWCRTITTHPVDGVCQPCHDDAARPAAAAKPAPIARPKSRPIAPQSAPAAAPVEDPAPAAACDTGWNQNPPEVTPAAAAQLDELLNQLAQVRATMATDLARIENAIETVRQTLLTTRVTSTPAPAPSTPVARPPAPTGHAPTGLTIVPRSAVPPARRQRTSTSTLDVAAVVRRYLAGETVPAIAADLGRGPRTVRLALKDAGTQMRDDRAGHSGSTPKDYPEQLVDDVRRLYLDERLSKTDVADRLHTTPKVVDGVMRRHGIRARHGESGRRDGAAPLKARITALGVPSHAIKTWAREQGLIATIRPGIVPANLVDAYELAHSTTARPPVPEQQGAVA